MIKGGPKTFIAQSYLNTDGPPDEGWWLLHPTIRQGASKNLFLELKDVESSSPYLIRVRVLYTNNFNQERPLFAKIVASMLRTNVARNVLLGITQPFDLVRPAKNGPKPHERLQVAWSYEWVLSRPHLATKGLTGLQREKCW